MLSTTPRAPFSPVGREHPLHVDGGAQLWGCSWVAEVRVQNPNPHLSPKGLSTLRDQKLKLGYWSGYRRGGGCPPLIHCLLVSYKVPFAQLPLV